MGWTSAIGVPFGPTRGWPAALVSTCCGAICGAICIGWAWAWPPIAQLSVALAAASVIWAAPSALPGWGCCGGAVGCRAPAGGMIAAAAAAWEASFAVTCDCCALLRWR